MRRGFGKANLSLRFVMLLAMAGMLLVASVASAAVVINFANTTGYGMSTARVMVENIRVDTEVANPFDPSHPSIVSSFYNVPFVFDNTNYHLVPDLGGAVVVDDGDGGGSTCATLDVYVSNAFTGDPLAGALVESGSSFAYTNFSGYAQLTSLVSGSALLSGSATGYVPSSRNVSVECGDDNSVGMALSPTTGTGSVGAGEIRVVLTWGENPRDLDSHLTGPDINNSGRIDETTNRFHVYYGHKNEDDVSLDTDDTSSYGPETITVTDLRYGLYRYSVHHYSGTSDISHSNASVQLWQGSTLIRTYTPPSGSPGDDAVWTVFEFFVDGTGTDLWEVNTYTADVSAGSVRTTTTGYGSVETGVDFTRLPNK